jgi:hypothetical protein
MGIVVDLNRSSITFGDPLLLDRASTIGRDVIAFPLHPFEIKFGISFDPDPKKGVGGAPADAEMWKIGIIQNELWGRSVWEYDGGENYTIQVNDAALDIVDKALLSKPFYADPDLGSARRQQRPYSDLWYTSQGYGELLSPMSASGVNTNNKPETFNMLDQPTGIAFNKSPKTGAWISRIERKLIFQTWLVAQTPNKKDGIVLAHVPPFALCFWFETDLKHFRPRYSFDTPDFDYGMYVEKGISPAHVNTRVKAIGNTPELQVALGNGGRNPHTKGLTANQRNQVFLRDRGMHP